MTYEDLNWIHPDLCTYRYRYIWDDSYFFDVLYTDEDSPVIWHWHLSVCRWSKELRASSLTYMYQYDSVTSGRSTIESGPCVYDYYDDGEYYAYGPEGQHTVINLDTQREAERAQHELYCFEWDLKTGKKNPTEYLFNEDETLRTIAKRYV